MYFLRIDRITCSANWDAFSIHSRTGRPSPSPASVLRFTSTAFASMNGATALAAALAATRDTVFGAFSEASLAVVRDDFFVVFFFEEALFFAVFDFAFFDLETLVLAAFFLPVFFLLLEVLPTEAFFFSAFLRVCFLAFALALGDFTVFRFERLSGAMVATPTDSSTGGLAALDGNPALAPADGRCPYAPGKTRFLASPRRLQRRAMRYFV